MGNILRIIEKVAERSKSWPVKKSQIILQSGIFRLTFFRGEITCREVVLSRELYLMTLMKRIGIHKCPQI
jgi:hypothetical protein